MTPGEIKELVETLRACGVTHYKEGNLELDLGPAPLLPEVENKENIVEEAKKYANQLFDNKYLLDKLFPDGASQEGESEEPAIKD